MPLPLFLGIMALAMVAAAMTVALAFWIDLPFIALGFAALTGSLIMGLRQWR